MKMNRMNGMNQMMLLKHGEDVRKKIAAVVDGMSEEIVSFICKLVRTRSLPGEELKVQRIVARKLQALDFDTTLIPLQHDLLRNHKAFSHDGFPFESRAIYADILISADS